jgi:hypothetical protein
MTPEQRRQLQQAMLARLLSMSREQCETEVQRLVSLALGKMSVAEIQSLRAEILSGFADSDEPLVEATLNLIEGHLALREINATNTEEEGA